MQNLIFDLLDMTKIKKFDVELNREVVIEFVNNVRNILFPGYFEEIHNGIEEYLGNKILLVNNSLENMLKTKISKDKIDKLKITFNYSLVNLKSAINLDVEAFLLSDPAVTDEDEIILSYPGFYAISLYRISNLLVKLDVPFIPRIISEHAHSKTGIDIHPKANIKECFFIDHGTGVVIGETTTIGKNVKIYQGVTLGALSLNNIEALKNVKRHPTIEDNVTIYSCATILGGETTIGSNSVIGSNVFITKSILPNSKVIFTNYDQLHKVKTT